MQMRSSMTTHQGPKDKICKCRAGARGQLSIMVQYSQLFLIILIDELGQGKRSFLRHNATLLCMRSHNILAEVFYLSTVIMISQIRTLKSPCLRDTQKKISREKKLSRCGLQNNLNNSVIFSSNSRIQIVHLVNLMLQISLPFFPKESKLLFMGFDDRM